MPLQIVATCALGLEGFVVAELAALGLDDVASGRGAVSFSGSWPDVWRANWRLRTANRVLVELGSWEGGSAEALAGGAERLVEGDRVWDGVSAGELLAPGRSFAIHSTSAASQIRDTRWISLKLKDGLVDAQRRRFGRRSSIERQRPDLSLRARLATDALTLFLDTSGVPLDRRGYRLQGGVAPLRENLAAACVLAAEWLGGGPIADPMCGSGTLLAEAGGWARGLAPGRLRSKWGFESLPGFDPLAWRSIRKEPIPSLDPKPRLFGVDRARGEVRSARKNLERSGLGGAATIEQGDGFSWQPPAGPGLLLVNPPYGERLDRGQDQWRRLGDLLKQRYRGWRAVILAGGEDRGKHIGLRPRRRIPVRNGPLDARILIFDLY